jgi:hypothetical protein
MKGFTLLSPCSQCPREQPYDEMFDCLMNDGKRVCRHCFTYQVAVRKNLQMGQKALKELVKRV